MPEKKIWLCLAHMSEAGEEMKFIKEAFDTNWVVPLGPNVNGFEADLEAYVNEVREQGTGNSEQLTSEQANEGQGNTELGASVLNKRVVALSSGTAAIHLGLVDLGVKAGDEVICQSFTFCASSHPVTYLGATPVFVDSEPESWNMDPDLLEVAINDRIAKTGRKPKAIIPVYLYGMPAQIDSIMAIANRYDIPVLEDAAEGFGSRYRGRCVGTFGRYGVLSFNGNKMITTSGGGALICPDEESWRRVMFYATQAREAYPYYHHEKIGYNYRMSNICAGIGRGQMTILDDHIAHHHRIARRYAEAFSDVEGITFHANPNADCDSNYWLSTIVLDEDLRVQGEEAVYQEAVKGAVGGAAGVVHATGTVHTDCEPNRNVEAMRLVLDRECIESRPLWKPMHLQPVYKDAPAYVNGVSESLFKRGLCLPSGPMVSDDDVERVIAAVKAAIVS